MHNITTSQNNLEKPQPPEVINIALIGTPNCGKTALFNNLTGSKQRVANYAGVTIEKKFGGLTISEHSHYKIVDLPGIYSTTPRSLDEKIAVDFISGNIVAEDQIDLIICVIDVTNIAKGLRLFFELKNSKHNIIIALNMMDLANKKGLSIDQNKLSQYTNCPVVPITAIKKHGISNLLDQIERLNVENQLQAWKQNHTPTNNFIQANTIDYHTINQEVAKIVDSIYCLNNENRNNTRKSLSDYVDNILLHPILGFITFFLILLIIFQAVFSWANLPQELIQNSISYLQNFILASLPNTFTGNLLANGVIAGVGNVIAFIPQILLISLALIILEDSGYMARVAFLMDKVMGTVGLQGKSILPLFSSFGCAIPGIMAARIIENRTDRILTILISPLMACSARISVYTLLISALIKPITIFGWFNLQGIVMLILYVAGMVFALIVAFVSTKLICIRSEQISIIELPSYKLPTLKNIIIEILKPLKSFLKRAGTIILAISILIWVLSNIHIDSNSIFSLSNHNANNTVVGFLGQLIQPLFALIGFSWQIVSALIPGMLAREVVISSLATIYAISNTATSSSIDSSLTYIIQHTWSMSTGFSLLTWFIFAPQCASTLAVVRRETNSWQWPIVMFTYQILLAYIMSFMVYNITKSMEL